MASRNLQILKIFSAFDTGLTSELEALAAFDALQIRGSFTASGDFTGYDYAEQCWIEEAA